MGPAGAAAAAGLPAPNVAHPTAASAGGYPPGAACSLAHALRCLGVLRMGLLCGLVLVPPRPDPCHLTSTAVLFGDLVVACSIVGTGAGLMWDGVSRGGGCGFLCGAVRCGAGSG
ncbi:unnamed protein product [Taenia asiatica]|uniref:Secreted protein n=1 Tax=Taenia asiatica TaxID=60517 RepID=A0A0R3VWU1_TAEAS|nr:unnamed protein product [Taenia asiatica]